MDLARPLAVFRAVSAPFTVALTKLANAIVRLFGVSPERLEEQHTEEDVKAIIRQSATGGEFRPRGGRDPGRRLPPARAAGPRGDDADPGGRHRERRRDRSRTRSSAASRSGHTRLIVIEDDNPDRVRGVVHNNSLVRLYMNAGADTSIEPAIREVPIFPETKPLDDLLAELQRQRSSIAVVSDEYGRTVGIVTVEDILEEVVGEIEDETDPRAASVRKLTDGDWYVRGHVSLGDLEDVGHPAAGLIRRVQLDRRLRVLRARAAPEARRPDHRQRLRDQGRVGAREPHRRRPHPRVAVGPARARAGAPARGPSAAPSALLAGIRRRASVRARL